MEILRPLTGTGWLGHYSNPEDAHYNHVMRWEPVLGGQSIRLVKHVDELSFEMETIFYWDPGEQQIACVSLTNRGQLSTGSVRVENGLIVIEGQSITKDGKTPFRTTYGLRPDGTLEDRFYLRTGEEWRQRHLILLDRMKDEE